MGSGPRTHLPGPPRNMLTIVDSLASAPAAAHDIPPRKKPADFTTTAEYRAHADKRRKCLESLRDQKRNRKGRTHPQRDREQAERQAQREQYYAQLVGPRQALAPPNLPDYATGLQMQKPSFDLDDLRDELLDKWDNPWHFMSLTPVPERTWEPIKDAVYEDYDAWARHLGRHGLVAGSNMQVSSEEKTLHAKGRARRHSV